MTRIRHSIVAGTCLLIGAGCSAASPSDSYGGPGGSAAHQTGSGGSGGTKAINAGGNGGKSGQGGTSGKPDGGKICDSVQVQSDAKTVVKPGNVLIVFDRSDSMNESFTTDNGCAPKYEAAGQALIDAVSPISDQLEVGALLFPTTSKAWFCTAQVDPITAPTQIDFQSGANFIQAWNAWWKANGLILGTPLNRAFDKADDALMNSGLQGTTVVVVFTDGEPVCTDGVPAPQRAASWLAMGIKTYVVGLPGAEDAPILNEIAIQGGTGAYLLPKDASALKKELSAIAETTISTTLSSCTIKLNPKPQDPSKVYLVVEDAATHQQYEVPRGDADGWKLSADGSTATILGSTCEDALQGRFSKVSFEYGCVDLPPLPK
ncbi:MAG: VWA domain-containing protein [Deltaproteobacteria bacterium]|nr:VWA domain-containing protein [Deltaproteobacteria bacterium]